MSYTIDMPPRESAYVERHGVRFRDELNALVLAFVAVRMQNEEQEPVEAKDFRHAESKSRNIVDELSGIVKLPADFDDKGILGRAALERYESIS